MHQLGELGEMREKVYLNLPLLPHLPHLPYLHSSQKKQRLMTTPHPYAPTPIAAEVNRGNPRMIS